MLKIDELLDENADEYDELYEDVKDSIAKDEAPDSKTEEEPNNDAGDSLDDEDGVDDEVDPELDETSDDESSDDSTDDKKSSDEDDSTSDEEASKDDDDSDRSKDDKKSSDEDVEDKKDKSNNKDKKDDVSTESITDIYREISLENDNVSVVFPDLMKTLARSGLSILGNGILSLAKFLTKSIYKLLVVSYKSIKYTSSYYDLKLSILESNRTDLKKLNEIIDLLDDDVSTDKDYGSSSVVQRLVVGDNNDIKSLLAIDAKYITDMTKVVANKTKQTTLDIKSIIASYTAGLTKVKPKLMLNSTDFDTLLKPGDIDLVSVKSEHVKVDHYATILPGDTMFLATTPKHDLKDPDSIIEAYSTSGVYMLPKTKTYQDVRTLPFLDKKELEDLINQIETFNDIITDSVELYKSIIKEKASIASHLKIYVTAIVKNNPSKEDSLIDHTYLKYKYMDEIFVRSMMLSHDHVMNVLTAAILYAKANVKALS